MSREVAVDQAAVRAVAGRMLGAADEVDAAIGSAPGGVDAGDQTATITSIIARFTRAATEITDGLAAGSQAVVDAGRALAGADDEARRAADTRKQQVER